MNVSRRIATTFFAIFAAAALASSLPSFSQPAQASVAFDDPWTAAPVEPVEPGEETEGGPVTSDGDPWH
ncbi:hypothetical protein HD597_012838 [Nonomuraea thailandensis]|uniref:Uncharacterized protein n=1 Tax=Nonomuraea thailandensis TaxID=1188745 RepID=A0A9X2GY19_9ACTN|nr:hypothetical protein [Nonomuraea thailandensis]MCP2365734.1 hypothetical protein [Nonomuraea thailandensis]